jgi:hypothetical protein
VASFTAFRNNVDSTFQTATLRRHGSAISRRELPELCQSFSLPSRQRAQGIPGARCTRGPVSKLHKTKRPRAYRFSGGNPAFPAQWFYGLSRAPRRSGFFVTVAGGSLTADLTPASRRQDHTILPYASAPIVHRRLRVHRTPLRVRDVAQRPSVWDGMAGNLEVIWVRRQVNNSEKQNYFCKGTISGFF